MVGFTGNRVGGGSKNPIADIDVPVANRPESANSGHTRVHDNFVLNFR